MHGRLMRWTHRCHPLMRRWVGWLSNIVMFFVGVCEDSYIKNITLFTAVPCPSCSTLTSPISRVTGGIIVAVTGLIAARAIGASFACYSKTNIINKTMFSFVFETTKGTAIHPEIQCHQDSTSKAYQDEALPACKVCRSTDTQIQSICFIALLVFHLTRKS